MGGGEGRLLGLSDAEEVCRVVQRREARSLLDRRLHLCAARRGEPARVARVARGGAAPRRAAPRAVSDARGGAPWVMSVADEKRSAPCTTRCPTTLMSSGCWTRLLEPLCGDVRFRTISRKASAWSVILATDESLLPSLDITLRRGRGRSGRAGCCARGGRGGRALVRNDRLPPDLGDGACREEDCADLEGAYEARERLAVAARRGLATGVVEAAARRTLATVGAPGPARTMGRSRSRPRVLRADSCVESNIGHT